MDLAALSPLLLSLLGPLLLAGVLVGLLAVPLQLAFQVRTTDRLQGHVSMRWLFGAVRWRTRLPRPARRRPAPAEADRPARPGRGRGRAWSALRDPAWRRRLVRLLRDLAGAVRVDHLALRVRLGLGDPADTGRLWAWLGPLSVAVRRWPAGAQVHLVPDFDEAVLALDARGRVQLVPLRILVLALAFALSPSTMRGWRAAVPRDASLA